jgi:hypothetical protein
MTKKDYSMEAETDPSPEDEYEDEVESRSSV